MKHKSTDQTDGPNKTDLAATAIVVASSVVGALQVGKAIIALPILSADLGLNLAQAAWVMAVFALLGVVGGIPAGVAVNRFGDRRLLFIGLCALALGSALGAFANNLVILLATRIVEGVGFLFIIVAAPAVLQRVVSSKNRDLVFAIWSTAMPFGIMVALLAGPWLSGWRTIWLANAALAGVIALLLLFVVRRGTRTSEDLSYRAVRRDVKDVLKSHSPLLLAFTFSCYTLQYFAVISFLPVLFVERMQVSIAMAGILSAVTVGGNIVGNLVAGMLLTRGVASWKLIAIANVAMGLAAVGIFIPATPTALVFILCILFSSVGGMLPAAIVAEAPKLSPSPQLTSISMGLIMQGSNLGQVIGPPAVGAIVTAFGWNFATLPVAIAATIGLGLALAFGGFFQKANDSTVPMPS